MSWALQHQGSGVRAAVPIYVYMASDDAAPSAAASEGGLCMQIASDLHLEMYSELPPLHEILRPSAPVLALLGDISALGQPKGRAVYEKFLEACSTQWQTILLLAGNHEYYSARGDDLCTVNDVLTYMRGLSTMWQNVRFLENEAMSIDGVRVAGTVLWTHVPPCQTIDGPPR